MDWLMTLFIGLTVFGTGVTLMDFLGMLGSGDSDGVSDSGSDGDADAVGDFDGDGDAEPGDPDEGGDEGGSLAGHDRSPEDSRKAAQQLQSAAGSVSGRRAMALLSSARNLVYFSLGFGPTGWFGLATGMIPAVALIWAAGAGFGALILVRLLRRLMRSELSSQVRESDLLMETGQVTVSIHPGALGRVRIQLGGSYVDRYARSRSETSLGPGTRVRVVDMEDECIIVEEEGGIQQ